MLLTEFSIFLPIILHFNRKSRHLPKGDTLQISPFLKALLFIVNKIFTYVLWIAVPVMILLDLYNITLIWTTFIPFLPSSYNFIWIQLSGMILFALGLVFIIHSRLVLKAYHAKPWEASKQGSSFVQTGIYSKIRHPIYTAVFLFLIGYSLWFLSWLAILCFILSLSLIKAVQAEEKWLLERFGEEYKNYMKKTGRFVPKCWG